MTKFPGANAARDARHTEVTPSVASQALQEKYRAVVQNHDQ